MDSHLKHGGWPYGHPPNADFQLNTESTQINGLVLWLPLGTNRACSHIDRVRGAGFSEGGTPVWIADGERGWSLFFDDGVPEYLRHSSFIGLTEPLTLAAWFRSDSITLTQGILSVGDVVAEDDWSLQAAGGVGGDPIYAQSWDGAVNSEAVSTTGYSANTWHHACGVFKASNDRAVFLDGGSKGTNGDNRVVDDVDIVTVAGTTDLTYAPFSGRIADVRIYNRALSDAEVYEIYRNPWELYKPAIRWWTGYRFSRIPRPPAAYNNLAIY